MTYLLRLITCLLVTVLTAAGVGAAPQSQDPPQSGGAPAQQVPQTPARGQRGARPGGKPLAQTPANTNQTVQQVQQMFDSLVLFRAQDVLQLTDEQFPLFFQKMQQLQRLRIRHHQERRRLIAELGQLTRGQAAADEATMAARIKALDDLEARMEQDERQAIAALDQTMTVRQRARFRVFEENMERQKLQMLAKALQLQPPVTPDAQRGPIKK